MPQNDTSVSVTGRRWLLKDTDRNAADALAHEAKLTPVAAQLLLSRGIGTADLARAFLKPSLNDLRDPTTLPDIEKAAVRICQAVQREERIVVYGDFDVDGITSTALMLKCLRLLGADAHFYLPDRLEEGYGLNEDAIRAIAGDGTGLLITVDCGISAVREITLAKELGLDVVVTDHHQPAAESAQLPGIACAVVSAMREDADCAFTGLAGVGVAFKVAWQIGKCLGNGEQCTPAFRDFLVDAMALVGLGTIADVVPLVDENRTLARFGLHGLSCSESPGIRALCKSARVGGRPLTAFDVGYKLGPRLNAAGRLGNAHQAVELLTTDDAARAEEIAEFLGTENTRRQKIQERILRAARAAVMVGGPVEERAALVVAKEGWHAGVVGVVAARLSDEFHRPTLILAIDGDEAHGSGRSIDGLDLFQALCDCDDLLTSYGGHAGAAGLRLPTDKVPLLADRLCRAVARRMPVEEMVPRLEVEAEIALADLSGRVMSDLEQLEPFGRANPEPVLMACGVQVAQVRRMGRKGQHMSLWARQNGAAVRGVAFGHGDLADTLDGAGTCDLAFEPRINDFRGQRNIELIIRDIRL